MREIAIRTTLTMAVLLACAGTMDASGRVTDRWDFDQTAGTTLNNLTNTVSGGGGWSGTGDSSVRTDGSGSLVYDSTGGNQFIAATGVASDSDTGRYEIEIALNAMTRVNAVNAGWNIRDAGTATTIAVIQFAQNVAGNGLRIFAFTTAGVNLNVFDYGAVSTIDNVTVRAVLTLDGENPGTIDFYATDDNVDLGAGVGTEAYLGSLPTAAGVTFNSIGTYKSNFTTGESATFDYLQVSESVPYTWDTATGDGTAITEGGGTWQVGVGNWNDNGSDVSWTDGNNAIFGGGAAGTAGTVTLGGNVVPSALTFDAEFAGDYTIDLNGNQLTLPNLINGVVGNSGFGPVTISDSAGTGALALPGNGLTISLISGTSSSDDGLIVSAKVTGAYDLLATDAGNLALNNGNNSFTGSLGKEDGGFLKVSSIKNNGVVSAAGAGSLIRLGSGADLAYTGTGDTHNRTLQLYGNGGTFSVHNDGSGPLVFSGPVSNETTAASTLDLGGSYAGTNDIQAVVANNGPSAVLSMTKNGPGTWLLSAANSFTGGLDIISGKLRIGSSGRLGNGSYGGDGTTLLNGIFDYGSTLYQILSADHSGSGQMHVTGAGTLELSGNNTYSGGTVIQQGILIANSASALGSGPVTMGANGPILRLGNGANIGGPLSTTNLSSAASIDMQGGATAATYSGAISHFSGQELRLKPSSGQTLSLSGSLGGTGTYYAFSGGSVIVSGTNATMTGDFKVGNFDQTRLIVGGSNALGGATILAQGESEFAAASAGIVISNHFRFPLGNNSYFLGANDFTISGTVTGAHGANPQNVYISGSANVTFAGDIGATASEYPRFFKTGTGSLRFTHADPTIYVLNLQNASGDIGLGSGTLLTIAGANPEIAATTSGSITGGTVTTASGDSNLRIDLSAGASLTIASQISGTNIETLQFYGSTGSVLTLTNPNNDFGNTVSVNTQLPRINGGTLSVSAIGNIGAAGPLGDSQRISLSPETAGADAAVRYTGTGETSDKIWNIITLTDTYAARIEASGSGPLQLDGSFVNLGTAGGKTVTLGGTGTGILNNTVNEAQGNFSLRKTDAGTWILANAGHNHTGTTIIDDGEMKVNGTYTGNGAWTVNSGGMLSGDGTINGAITVNGIVAPGDGGVGTLTVNGNVIWGSTATPGANTDWQFDLAAGDQSDLLDINGNFTKSGSGSFRFNFGGSTEIGTFTLVQWSGTTTFDENNFSATGVGGGNSATFSIIGNALIVTIGNCSGGSPTITLGTYPASCGGVAELALPYLGTTLNADTFTIDYDSTAEAAGFVDVTTRRPLGIINDDFSTDTTVIDAGNTLNEFDADFTWHKNKESSSWSVTGGQLVNNPDPSGGYDGSDEGLIGQMVDMSGFAGSTLSISFDYNVGSGNTLYLHARGADDQGSLDWRTWLFAPGGSAWDSSSGGSGTRYNLFDGHVMTDTWPYNGAFPGATAITGSGTYTTNIDLSGYAVADLADYEYLMIGFAMDITADNDTTIDNVLVTSGNLPVIVPVGVANGTYNGTITVYNTNNCSGSENFTVTITGNAPSTPGLISGQPRVCASDSGLTYSISQVAGATSYVWSVPSGVLVTATNATRTEITVDWNSAADGTISVYAEGVCGDSSAARNLPITADAVTPNAPVALAAENVTQSGFDARWNSQAAAQGYYLDMATLPNFSAATLIVSNELWTLNTKDTRTFSNLELGNYYYRLRSYNACGISDYSGVITVTVSEVIANWDTSAQTGGPGNYGTSPLLPRTFASSYVTVTGLTRGAGVSVAGTGLADGWGGEGWNAGDQSAAESAGDYLTFTIVPGASVNVNYSGIDVLNLRVEANGPTDGVLQYSLNNGVSFSDIIALSYTATVGGAYAPLPISLSGVSALQNVNTPVTFRIVNWGASDSSADWYIYDVNASTSPDLQLLGTFCEDPTAYTVTGGGIYCQPDGVPPAIGLSGSESSVSYQLYLDQGAGPVADGSPVFGDGGAVSFGAKTQTGTYTVVATRLTGSGCSAGMSGSAVVSTAYTPDVPSGLAADFDDINGEIDLTWNAASGASNYIIYRATISGGPYTAVDNTGATTYSDGTVIRNTIEYFYVISASSGGCETAYSGEISATTDVQCQSGVAPTLTAPGDVTVTAGDSVQHAITASDSASSCGTPTIVQYPSTLPSYITYVDSPSGPNRTRTYTIAPTLGDNGEVRPIRVVTWDDDGNTNDYTFVVYVGSQAASSYAVTITALSETTPNAAADLTFDSEEGLTYDVYSSSTPPGANPNWTKISSGIPADNVSVTTNVVASGEMRFYQVAPSGVSRTDNGIWAIVRPTVSAGISYLAPPVVTDRRFDLGMGAALADALPVGTLIYLLTPGASGSFDTTLERNGAGQWVLQGTSTEYTTPLPQGAGMLISSASAGSPTFEGAVGNDGNASITIEPGFNIVGVSEGRALPASSAFNSVVPEGSWDSEAADQVIILEDGGSWRRLIRRPDGQWADTASPNSTGTSLYLMPGKAYYYIRRGGQATLEF